MVDIAKVRKFILTLFKFNGLTVRSDACDYFAEQLNPLDENEREEWLDKIIDFIQKQPIDTPVIGKQLIEAAILDCCKSETDENITTFNVVSAFDIPHFNYNIDRKKFIPLPSVKNLELFGSPESKCKMFKERYTLLKQRTERHELFSVGQQFQLQPVEYLLSSGSNIQRVIVLGMLTQLKENRFYLEDPSGCVPLNLSKANYHTGFFTESTFVLVEGNYKDRVLHVQALGFPPPEIAENSRVYFASNNIFGGLDELNVKTSVKLKQIEESNGDAMIVFISDIWLDHQKVVEKLRVLFAGYNSFPPTAMVLMGNFLSHKQGSQLASVLQAKLKLLADLLAQFPELVAHTRFVIVPGPTDCLFANILPRPALIPFLTEDFKKKVPNVEFATNPCRIQYCTQEIMVLREDVVTKLCRNCIHFPSTDEIPDHFAKTVISQAHMAPLPSCVCPIYWDHDAALRLYPLPDVVVVADQMKSFTASHMNCSVVNPGSFSKGDFGFKVYYPSSKTVEDSQIPEDTE